MCVRSCDGYFFPVSYSTGQKSIVSDAGACEALCPGTDMQLYYHRTSSETAEQMVSARSGKPYSELPTAFSYRKLFNPSCRCNYKLLTREPSKQSKRAQSNKPAQSPALAKRQLIARIARPTFRMDPDQDPETRMTALGNFTMAEYGAFDPSRSLEKKIAPRRIRIIGEEFFPNQ